MGIKTVQYNKLSFVNIENPGETEIKYLKRYYPFHPLNLEDYVTKTQRPKIEEYRHYILVVLDFPYFKSYQPSNGGIAEILMNPPKTIQKLITAKTEPTPKEEVNGSIKRLYLSEVSFFIGPDYLVVLHEGNLPPINNLFEKCQKTLAMRKKFMGEGIPFLFYSLVDQIVDYCFPILDKITSEIEQVDREILTARNEQVVAKISLIRRNIVLFHTMMKPTIPLFTNLEEGKTERLNGGLKDFWGNLVEHFKKILDSLDDARELTEGISLSNESILTFRTNEIVKFLTIITSIAFPFVIVNNLYSMNVVGLPYANEKGIVWALFSVILVAGVSIILYFRIRKWI